MVSSRSGKAKKITTVDDELWKILGGSIDDVRPASDPYLLSEDEQARDERLNPSSISLHRISDATGKIKITKEKEGPIKWGDLDQDDVFLVHANIGIWVWVGTGANRSEKSKALAFADAYIADNNLSKHVPCSRLVAEKKQDKLDAMFGNMVTY